VGLRIVTGQMSGRKIEVPDNNGSTRPTMDRTREAVFNALRHQESSLDGAVVLDVFAGSGAYGIEALSNGAAYVTFFEQNHEAIKAIQNSIKTLGLGDITSVCNGSATAPPDNRAKLATHAFFDPPYGRDDLLADSLAALQEKGWIDADTLLIIEREQGKKETPPLPDTLEVLKEKKYGRALITYAKMGQ